MFDNIYSKVAASGTAGLVATVIIGLLGLVHVTLPAAVVSALVTLVTFAAGYLKREKHVQAVLADFTQAASKHAAPPAANG